MARLTLTGPGRRIALAVAVALALVAAIVGTVAMAGVGGGRSDRPDAKPAPGPETQRATPKVPAEIVHAAESGDKAVNITIDDGPDPTWTPKVLDVLEKNGVKAVFCMIGPNAKAHPDLVRKVVAAGHRLCDHSMTHDTAMDQKSVAYQEKEILDAKRLIEEASGGAPVPYYRAPGGAFTPDSRRIAADHGMRPLGWNVDTKDFQHPGTAGIVATVKRQVSPERPTILFHDGGGERSQTVAALEQVLPWLKEQGYAFSFPKIH
ncbi:polysaccharide deacetylase family protein [Streptomyces sp. URMC 123]|uniref:polysaccharide deacetylase family protein n=1 Tax=Streptomyces sp. URMC 123 TaxID=3423403 RepID=UPI003F1D1E37